MKVRALRKGQKPDRKWAEVGEVFDFAGPKLATWMELVDAPVKAPAPPEDDQEDAANLDAEGESETVEVLSDEPDPPVKRKVGRPKKRAS